MEYADNFSQADENPLSSGGVWEGGYTSRGELQVVNNRVRPASVGIQGYSTVARSFANDQFVQFTIPTFTDGSVFRELAGLLRAAAPPTDTTYRVTAGQNESDGTDYIQIYKFVDGAETTLAGPLAVTWSGGDTITGIIRGSTIFAFQNGALKLTATDSAITSGRIGLALAVVTPGTVGEQEIDNFAGGDIRKTRFYLPDTGAAEISPAFTLGSSWTATTGADRIRMPVARINSTMTTKAQAAPGTSGGQKWLFRQFVSDPIRGGGDIFGSLFGQIRGLESATNDNIDAISLKLLVVDGSGSLRGTLLSLGNYGTIAELNGSLRNKIIADGDGLTKVTYQNGDRIVAEIGLTNTANGTSISGSLSFGDNSATDLAEDEAATAANNPWLEFVGVNLQLGRQPMTKPNLYATKRATYH